MESLDFLAIDPRPELPDSRQWQKLLRTVPLIEDKEKAYNIHTLLWSFRSYGTVLRSTASGYFFAPTLDKQCEFDTLEEFNAMKNKYFRPYRDEIAWILRKVAGSE